ncbi:hypothetical protein ScalyP_jg7365 [Parmales sp. scaly parma]|nr:hypothetical protein ScalyP_jg7365 [Parmales sp. scaly parma]|tara:strand:+ start:248 stop:619 length:372 start_codon:yes stop_codon:yes gene_type:complete
MVKVKAHDLRESTKDELVKQLNELKEELATLRVAKVTGGAVSKLAKIKVVRRSIARVLTVYNQKERTAMRELNADNKYKPLSIRKKTTRAMRRALTKDEVSRKTQKTVKKERHFPLRKFALKA